MHGCTSSSPIPSNLHTSLEARRHALRSYPLSFQLPHGKAKIFFNPGLDVLYFGAGKGFGEFCIAATMIEKSERKKVRRLAVHEEVVGQGIAQEFWEYVRRKFDAIEEVAVVYGKVLERKEASGWGYCTIGTRESLEENLKRGLEEASRGTPWIVPNWGLVEEGKQEWLQDGLPKRKVDVRPKEDVENIWPWPYCEWCENGRLY
jgi:GNAT superfamily N-acetyltransferase